MLAPIKHLLSNYRVVLASGSPRRQELVQLLVNIHTYTQIWYANIKLLLKTELIFLWQGLNAELCPSTFEENLNLEDFKEFSEYIEATALGKAEEVFNRLSSAGGDSNLLVIAADTMVTLGKEIYGKPKDAADAVRMLTKWVRMLLFIQESHSCNYLAVSLGTAIASTQASYWSMRTAYASSPTPPMSTLDNWRRSRYKAMWTAAIHCE